MRLDLVLSGILYLAQLVRIVRWRPLMYSCDRKINKRINLVDGAMDRGTCSCCHIRMDKPFHPIDSSVFKMMIGTGVDVQYSVQVNALVWCNQS